MAAVIRDGAVVENDVWRRLEAPELALAGAGALLPEFAEHEALLVPLALWRLHRDVLVAHRGPLALQLEPADDPEEIVADAGRLAMIALNFPKFTDGRGYSTARWLRERYEYRGELRAVGDVLRDQLYYLARCGFNAFELRHDQDAAAALSAFDDFTEAYQASVDRPQPLFRRRVAAVVKG